MSGFGGPGGGRGPGYGYDNGPDDGPDATPTSVAANAAAAARGGGSNLPVWALVLIMVGSALITLTCLWLCVLFLCRKRRARRAAVRDLEVQTSERETVRMLGHGEAKEVEDHAKRCESDAGVELTFVVMAGEDQPSYLARPAAPIFTTPPEEFKKGQQQLASSPLPGLAVATTEQPVPENYQKTPPSPS